MVGLSGSGIEDVVEGVSEEVPAEDEGPGDDAGGDQHPGNNPESANAAGFVEHGAEAWPRGLDAKPKEAENYLRAHDCAHAHGYGNDYGTYGIGQEVNEEYPGSARAD